MKPLLEITTMPAKYEYQVQNARLEINQNKAKVQRNVKPAALNIKKQAGRWDMNTVNRRSDMGFKGVVNRANYEGERGRQAALEATGNYAEFGNQLLNIQRGANIPDAAWNKQTKYMKGELVFVPLSPIGMDFVPANVSLDYVPQETEVKWDAGGTDYNFVPGSFGINMTQYPAIEIRYMGTPVYAPPSAEPGYVGTA